MSIPLFEVYVSSVVVSQVVIVLFHWQPPSSTPIQSNNTERAHGQMWACVMSIDDRVVSSWSKCKLPALPSFLNCAINCCQWYSMTHVVLLHIEIYRGSQFKPFCSTWILRFGELFGPVFRTKDQSLNLLHIHNTWWINQWRDSYQLLVYIFIVSRTRTLSKLCTRMAFWSVHKYSVPLVGWNRIQSSL